MVIYLQILNVMKEFRERLAVLFEESGKLQPKFAESIGVSEKTYRNYRDGITQPNADVLANIARAYNVNCEWLILGEGPIYKDQTPTKELPILNHPAIKKDDTPKDATSQEYKDMASQLKEMQKQISTLITTNQQLVDKLLNK